jgi:transcriptional regulator of acetoin/glycerol metabolism
LLRVLQQREVVPVGGSTPEPVDFRLITATHRNLEQKVAVEEFRADLMARISGLTLTLPSLADRRVDLGLLIPTLLERVAPGRELSMTVRAVRALLSYHWPLNVRELEKALELAAALAREGTIDVDHLPPPVRGAQTERPAPKSTSKAAPELSPEDEARRAELVALLEQHDGNLAAVARDMGKARMQIHRWLKRYEIDPEQYR